MKNIPFPNNPFKSFLRKAIRAPKRIIQFYKDLRTSRNVVKMFESLEQAPENETAIVSRLINSYCAASEQTIPSAYQPGAEWKKLLDSQWGSHREAIHHHEVAPIASFLRNFFRNEGLSGFWGGKMMFENFVSSGANRAGKMQKQFDVWREVLPMEDIVELQAPRIGNPWGYLIDNTLLYEPACEYHYHAHYFASLLADIPSPIILEIGGGFGGLAYHLVKRIRSIKYIGLDLPENILIQAYYLMCAFPELKILLYGEPPGDQDIILLPNFMLPEIESVDLIVNVRSLSEMLMETIIEYHRQIDRITPLFFFHENIAKPRLDGLHGIPSREFPVLKNLIQIAASETRWPRYKKDSSYPCQENLYIRRSAIARCSPRS